MTTPVERCDECRRFHIPGVCDPNDLTEAGWRAYRAVKATAFPKTTSGQELANKEKSNG